MQTLEWTDVDRSGWNPGPWDSEPDRKQWLDESTGLPCLAVRNPRYGNWCGYVGVPPGHPYFEKDYCDVGADVHGGLTYAAFCDGHRICHVVDNEEDRVWWLGFDCLHCWDSAPKWHDTYGDGCTYKSLRYIESQCRDLARQFSEASA